MLIAVILLIVGFAILIVGADYFVDGASSTALNFKLSKMLIGLTIVAFGTSAPEFAISMQSLINGSGDILLGNVIGSNILNALLILGLASLICPLKINNTTIKKEMPMMLLISTILVVVTLDQVFDPNMVNLITRSDGIVITLFFLIFVYYLIRTMRNKVDEDEEEKPKYGLKKSILVTILGIIAIIIGSDLIVDNAIIIAENLGISERLISLTIIAFGTSLPELVTSVTAAVKHEEEIAVGNIVGSNIFNICIVLGIPISIFGGITPSGFSIVDIIMLLLSSIVLFIFASTKHKISKREGFMMLVLYAVYFIYLVRGGIL